MHAVMFSGFLFADSREIAQELINQLYDLAKIIGYFSQVSLTFLSILYPENCGRYFLKNLFL